MKKVSALHVMSNRNEKQEKENNQFNILVTMIRHRQSFVYLFEIKRRTIPIVINMKKKQST
jgi:hypothetical protein